MRSIARCRCCVFSDTATGILRSSTEWGQLRSICLRLCSPTTMRVGERGRRSPRRGRGRRRRRAAASPEPCAPAGGGAEASRRRPSGGRRRRAAAAGRRLSRAQQLHRRALEQVAVGLGVAGGWRPGRSASELGHEPRQHLAAAEAALERLGVADAQQELEPLPQRLVRRADRRVRGAVEHEHAARRRLVRELAHEPRLAAAGLAASSTSAALAALGPLEQRAQRRQLARRGRRTGTAAPARAAPGSAPARREPRTARARAPRPGSRICRSSSPQRARPARSRARRAPPAPRGTPRAPPPAGPSGRARASAGRAEPLAVRVLARSAPRARRRARAWRPSARSASIRSSSAASRSSSSRPASTRANGSSRELGQRRPAPERERLAQQARRLVRGRAPRASATSRSNRAQVDRLGLDLEHVARRPRHEHPVRQQLPQPRDVDLHAP